MLLVGITPGGAFGTGCRRSVFDGGGVAPVVVTDRGCPPVRSRRCAGEQAMGVGLLRGGLRCWAGWRRGGGEILMVWPRQPTLSAVQPPHHLVSCLRGRRRVFHVRHCRCHYACKQASPTHHRRNRPEASPPVAKPTWSHPAHIGAPHQTLPRHAVLRRRRPHDRLQRRAPWRVVHARHGLEQLVFLLAVTVQSRAPAKTSAFDGHEAAAGGWRGAVAPATGTVGGTGRAAGVEALHPAPADRGA